MFIKIALFTLLALIPLIVEIIIVLKMDEQADPKDVKAQKSIT
ncbi:MAG TPA: hypothetical protein PLP48_08945 [Acholeplasmataceae bacterium]|nr:hypothetical protein [Acholeplasmataceae bacterium]